MRRFIFASFVIGSTACTGILGSFDVTDAVPTSPESSLSDTATSSGGPTTDGAVDAPLVCEAGLACGGSCVDPNIEPKHCGRCGHDCGGGQCAAGVCQSTKVYEDLTVALGSFSVGATEVFFGSNDKLLACNANGCKGAPPRQAGQTQYGFRMAASRITDTLLFESAPVQNTERPAMGGCPLTGCPAVLDFWVGDGLNGFVDGPVVQGNQVYIVGGGVGLRWTTCTAGACVEPAHDLGIKSMHGLSFDTTNVYFVDAASRGGAISKCAHTDNPCVPTPLVSGDASGVERVLVFENELLWIIKGRDDFSEGKIVSCNLPGGCVGSTPTPIANGLDSPVELAVDATGLYWINHAGVIQHCLPNGCPGGPQAFVAGPITTAHNLVLTDDAVYWGDAHAINKLAKP